MFNRVIIFSLFLLTGLIQAHPTPNPAAEATTARETYDTKFDNIDIDEILGSERLLKNYVNCLAREGPCTTDGKMLQEILPDAVSTDCMKCTEKQKTGSEKVTHYLIDNKPQDWERLEKLYDPQGSYRKAYLEEKGEGTKE
uniref:CSP2 n=1 Tax=Eupeodes corollae TaxID=290404 RepID=A0A8F9S0R6_9MUSC|nr:CSP2 [Eupeodes corollae]